MVPTTLLTLNRHGSRLVRDLAKVGNGFGDLAGQTIKIDGGAVVDRLNNLGYIKHTVSGLELPGEARFVGGA